MAATAEDYFQNLSLNIPEGSRNLWEREMQDAEANRLSNASRMDILGSRLMRTEDIREEMEVPPVGTIEYAIYLALGIEEKQ